MTYDSKDIFKTLSSFSAHTPHTPEFITFEVNKMV